MYKLSVVGIGLLAFAACAPEPCTVQPVLGGVMIVCPDQAPVYLFHGQDGKDGRDGKDGKDGQSTILSTDKLEFLTENILNVLVKDKENEK